MAAVLADPRMRTRSGAANVAFRRRRKEMASGAEHAAGGTATASNTGGTCGRAPMARRTTVKADRSLPGLRRTGGRRVSGRAIWRWPGQAARGSRSTPLIGSGRKTTGVASTAGGPLSQVGGNGSAAGWGDQESVSHYSQPGGRRARGGLGGSDGISPNDGISQARQPEVGRAGATGLSDVLGMGE